MKKFAWLFFIVISLGLSSCIDLLDEITLHDNKSGSVFIGIESELLGSIMKMAKDQIQADKLNNIEHFPNKSKDKLEAIQGISNVNALSQINKGRLGISFDFANPKALNNAYYALVDMEKKWYEPKIVKIGKHKISRPNFTPQIIKQIELENPEFKNSEYLKYLNLKTIIKLPRKSTTAVSGGKKELKNSNMIVIRNSFVEILNEQKSTAYKIRF